MRPVVLQFWLSLDGYSMDVGTELFQMAHEIADEEQDEHLLTRLRQAGDHIMGRLATCTAFPSGIMELVYSPS